MSVDRLSKKIIDEPDIEGITISGGEPFLQAGPLADLVRTLRDSKDLGVIIYTGYTLKELLEEGVDGNRRAPADLLGVTDLLIDGPYVRELDDGLSLRGSSIQKIHLLTGRYADVAGRCYGATSRHVELHLRDDGLFLAGIPGPDALKKWRDRTVILPGPH